MSKLGHFFRILFISYTMRSILYFSKLVYIYTSFFTYILVTMILWFIYSYKKNTVIFDSSSATRLTWTRWQIPV